MPEYHPAMAGDATSRQHHALPMPPETAEFQLDISLTPDETRRALQGHVPADMDDKWFVAYRDGQLFFHRSWTGTCIYRTSVEIRPDQSARITSAWANRNPTQYKNMSDEFDRAFLSFLVEHLLAGRDVPFPQLRPVNA